MTIKVGEIPRFLATESFIGNLKIKGENGG